MDVQNIIIDTLLQAKSFEKKYCERLEEVFKTFEPVLEFEEYLALYITEHFQGPTQQELAVKATFDKTFVKRLVDKMEKKGLMVRFKDTTDRRANRLVITRSGREILARAELEATRLLDPFADQKNLLENLNFCQGNLRRMKKQLIP